jgi:putative ABC transport system substrate-binding protein
VTSGALVSVGADFYEVGQEIGRMAGRVIKGESPADIPIESFAPEKIWVNAGLAKAYGITLPPTFMDRVSRTVNGP